MTNEEILEYYNKLKEHYGESLATQNKSQEDSSGKSVCIDIIQRENEKEQK